MITHWAAHTVTFVALSADGWLDKWLRGDWFDGLDVVVVDHYFLEHWSAASPDFDVVDVLL